MSLQTYLNPTDICAGQTAVMLNANAKRVTPKLVERVSQVVPHRDLFLSRSMEEARDQVQTVVARGYHRLLSGGGDGTLMNVVTLVDRLVRESTSRGREVEAPEIGVLRLGTGNAVASVLGAGRFNQDVARHLREDQSYRVYLDMVRSVDNDTLCPFTGIGYDGEILNDYNWLKQHARGPLSRLLMQTSLGYLTSLFSRTVPRKVAELGRRKPVARVTSLGRAFYVDPKRGDELVPWEDELLYEGPVSIISAGSVPYYGFRFKMFPFAGRRPGFMQLRVASVGALPPLMHLGKLWKGTFRHPQIQDFLVEEVRVEGERPLPYQLGGDAYGERDSLHLRVSENPVAMAALRPLPRALPAAA
jgi:diacylglycerol kinase family enzyme